MEENLEVDKGYLKAFNLGYELAKELNLESPMFKELNPGNIRLNAMQAGMAEYCNEIIQRKNKAIEQPLGMDNRKNTLGEIGSKEEKRKGKDRGLDLSI